jgi:hypothetical protein
MTRIALIAAAFSLSASAGAQDVTIDDLVGLWSYDAYAEIETPDEKRPVGARMEFRSDGTVLMTLSTGTAEATYSIDGDTIVYSDANGTQEWTVRSYVPNESLVVEYQRALIFFTKIDSQ